MPKATFTTIIKGEPGGPAGIEVPPDVIAALGTSKKPAVWVHLPGFSYQNTVAVMGGAFMISLSKARQQESGVKAGDKVEVTLELDTEERTVEVPEDLTAALAKKPGAKEAFDKLAFSRRKEFVRQVVEAKAQDTRERRIAKIVEQLPEKK
jgi:hypothetical protein